jgi:hypothetical protein
MDLLCKRTNDPKVINIFTSGDIPYVPLMTIGSFSRKKYMSFAVKRQWKTHFIYIRALINPFTGQDGQASIKLTAHYYF